MPWQALAMLATTAIVIVYGMILGIAKAFNQGELEKHAKAEILNGIATAIIVVSLVTMLPTIDNFAMKYFLGCTPKDPLKPDGPLDCKVALKCGGEDKQITQLTDSIDLLQCRFKEKAQAFADIQQQLTENAVSKNPFSVFNRLSLYVGLIGIPIFQGNYISSWFNEAESYRLLNNFLTNALIGINTLVVTGDFVKNNMLAFFLPVGVLLRAFPFTRGIGAFFIALAIGFYFIFPLLYVITDPGFVKPVYKPQSGVSQGTPLCFPTLSSVSYSIYAPALGTGSSSSGAALSLNALLSDLSSVYVSLLLQPFVVFSVTIVFVRYITSILGGETADILRAVAKVV
jgi:hypothetical protein